MAKRALLVGVNDYRNFNDLKGCINDLKSVRKVLMNYLGFEAENIRVVVDDRATKENIVCRLRWLVESGTNGDHLFFHFSGHGSQIRDRDGDELEDHMDELICPYDMDWDGTFITDDQLACIFDRLEDHVLLEVSLDCCHSGTGTRELLPAGSDRSLEEVLSRYLEPPFDIACRSDVYQDLPIRGFGHRSEAPELNHVLWSACKANQTAADAYINGRFHGAFSHYFCQHMEATAGMVSRLGLLRRIQASIRHAGFSQIPQLIVPEGVGARTSFTEPQ